MADIPSTMQAATLLEMFDASVEKYADQVCYIHRDTTLTYRELQQQSQQFCAYLQQQGISKGDRVALMSPNTPAFLVSMWGILRAGAVQVNTNPQYTARELSYQLDDADVSLLVFDQSAVATVASALTNKPACKLVCIGTDQQTASEGIEQPVTLMSEAMQQVQGQACTQVEVVEEDTVFLQYTGGTTGFSKGAVLSHSNIMANIGQTYERLEASLTGGDNVIMTVLPAYHIFALTANLMLFFAIGGKNVLISNPKEADHIVEQWQTHQVTALTGVNTLFNNLLNYPPFRELDFSSLRLSVGGGAAVLSSTATNWQALTGIPVFEGYGLSETSPVLSINLATENGGIGKPVQHTRIRIVDDMDRDVPDGEEGELAARGPQVMSGYWNKPEANKASFTDDGYFKTGDVAYKDERGHYHIVDRKKDMILVSGFNVYPNEVENAVCMHDGVLEAACVGTVDERQGEKVRVFVVRKSDDVTEEAILAICKDNLAGYKMPKDIIFVDEIPKSSVGKILRRKLKDAG